jgi:hypothetical protein
MGLVGITFNQVPKLSSTLTSSTTGNELATKKYVDDSIPVVPDVSGFLTKDQVFYSGDVDNSVVIAPRNTFNSSGVNTVPSTKNSINIGGNPFPDNNYDRKNIVIGSGSYIKRGPYSFQTSGPDLTSVVVGLGCYATGGSVVVIGNNAYTTDGPNIAIGNGAYVKYTGASSSGGIYNVAIGNGANCTDSYGVAIGYGASAGANTIALGGASVSTLKFGATSYSISDIATKTYVNDKVAAITIPDVSGLATETYVDEAVGGVVSKSELNITYTGTGTDRPQTIQFGEYKNGTSYSPVRINFGRGYFIEFAPTPVSDSANIASVEFGYQHWSETMPVSSVKLYISNPLR